MEKLKKAMHDHACFPARETGSVHVFRQWPETGYRCVLLASVC